MLTENSSRFGSMLGLFLSSELPAPAFGKLVLGLLLWRIFQLDCRWIAHTPDEGSTLQSSGELLLCGYFSHGRVVSLIVNIICVISRVTCWGPKCFLCVK